MFNKNVKLLVMSNYNLLEVSMFSNSNGLQFNGRHSEDINLLYDCSTFDKFSQFKSLVNALRSILRLKHYA